MFGNECKWLMWKCVPSVLFVDFKPSFLFVCWLLAKVFYGCAIFSTFASLFECNANPTTDGAVNQSYLRYGVGSHFVTVGVQVLHLTVIGPFVRHVESGGDRASIGVDAAVLKQVLVQLLVQVIHGIVECQQDDLRHLFHGHIDFASDGEWMRKLDDLMVESMEWVMMRKRVETKIN